MKRFSFTKKTTMVVLLALILVASLFFGTPAKTAKADAGDPPAHGKTVDDNGDGTYKLELFVTGDADNETQEAGGVNVVIVYDISQSMSSNAGSTRYSRADQAEDVVHDFLTNLAGYQNAAGNNIRVSLVNFAVTATQVQGWSTDVTGLANRFDDGGTDGHTNFTYNGYGTNWEHALQRAQTLVNGVNNSDPVFVIMITDGAPTASGTDGGNAIAPTGATIAQLRDRYNAATGEAEAIATAVEGTNGTFYGIYAYGTEADLLDDLMYYSTNGQHRGGNINNVVAATQDADNYFNAGETSALQAAIDEIFDKVVQAMGISSVSISDGTTNQVETSTGEISELLEVDTTSYQYWLSIPLVGNQFERVDRDGNTVTYTVTNNGNGTCTITWGTKTVTVDGAVSGSKLKYEWTEANDLYNYDPPEATLNNGAVDWNISAVGTLLDGVTYSVTFDVYPSQATLDIVADIKNDPGENGAWADLDPVVQQYIDVNGRLKTNTTAKLTYSDTRLENPGPKEVGFDNPDPVENSAIEELAVTKRWDNSIDTQEQEPVTLKVTRDGKEVNDTYNVTLSDNNGWKDSVYISIGIMRTSNGTIEVLSPGHDFTFIEPVGLSYHWELNVPTVRPMLVDGKLKMLVKEDAKHQAPSEATKYEMKDPLGNDAVYYVDDTITSLEAVNERRSRLNIKKVVDGEAADPDQPFEFTVTVNNSGFENGSADNLDSDYYVWFSVYNGGYIDALVSENAQKEIKNGEWTGFYYAKSGTVLEFNLKKDDNLRFLNLPSGSTYTISEGTLPDNYVFTSAVLSEGTDSNFVGAQTTNGSIVVTNKDYTVTYTNTYSLANVEVTKVWSDANNQDGIRPTATEFVKYLTLKAGETDVTATYANNLTVTDNNDGTYTIKWTNVNRYANGEEIEYTVTESAIDDYSTSGSPAKHNGTITNTHTPAVRNITVTKAWAGDTNLTHLRPESITVQLSSNDGTATREATLNANNNWSYTWENLPVNNAGTAIVYTVKEVSVTGYTTEMEGTDENGVVDEDGNVTITNTLDVGNLSVTKTVTSPIPADSTTKEYPVKITLSDTSITGTFGGITFTNGVAEFTIKAGTDNTKTATGLPAGITYKVEETVPEYFDTPTYTNASGSITKGGTVEAKIANTRKLGSLEVSKKVSSALAADKTRNFTFKVTLGDTTISGTFGDMAFTNGVAEFTLQDGQKKTATGLPEGVTYTVAETAVDGLTVSPTDPITGTISSTKPETAEFTNTRKTTSLTVAKKLVSDRTADADTSFPFKVTLDDETISGTFGEMTFTNGVAEFTLKGGEQKTASNLPTDLKYKVEETAVSGFTKTTPDNAEGTLKDTEGGTKVELTNTRVTANLSVTKVVVSPAASDTTRTYKIKVQLDDTGINGTFGGMTFTNGVAEFEIKAGENNTVTAKDLPTGVKYEVTETSPGTEYTVSYKNPTGTLAQGGAEVTVTNTRNTGKLTVTKTVTSTTTTDHTREFTFTVTLSDDTVAGKLGDMTFTAGKATFTLIDGGTATAEGLPVGVTYTVTETEANANGFVTSPENGTATGTISATTESKADFTNVKSEGSLVVTKLVVSDLPADTTAEYAVKVTLKDTTINGTYGAATFTGGVATLQLTHNKPVTISGLPDGTGYEVSEEALDGFTVSYSDGKTGTIEKDKTASATVTNTRKTGTLTVSKVLVSALAGDADQTFTFKITLTPDISGTFSRIVFEGGKATVTLKGGESKTIEGLPTTVQYKVEEDSVSGFITEPTEAATGTITETASTVTFKNTRETGSLEVTKTVKSAKAADADVEFEFTVKLADETISGEYGEMTFKDGVATFKLKDGGKITATNLPTTVGYEVTEKTADGFTTEKQNATGTISTTKSTAAFTNTRIVADLKVTKKVVSPAASDSTKEYKVKITLSDTNITGTFGDIEFTGGKAEFTLKGDESKTAKGLPTSITYTVEEVSPGEQYTVSGEVKEATELLASGAEVTITNTRKLGKITVTKNVTSTTETDHTKEFTFTITLKDETITGSFDDVEFTNGVATITLKDGDSQTITGLPLGVEYTVAETEDKAFATTTNGKESGSITEDGTEVIFTNTRNEGGLTVAKTVVSDLAADNEATYKITITLSDKTLNGKYGDATFTNGVAPVELKNGETANITGLPEGVTYEVKEEEPKDFTVEYTGATGEIKKAETASATVTNTRETGKLTISKKVDSPLESDKKISFEFTITLSEKISKTYSEVVFTDGVATISLKDGESKTIEGIPTTVTYKVEEKAVTGFTPKAEGDEGTITTTESKAAFTNSSVLTEKTVTKVWEDNNDQDGKRPEKITVKLLANGETYRTAELNKDNGWKFTFTGLPEYKDGEKITYTVDEEDVTDYEKKIDDEKLTITNTHTPEPVEITITKTWDDKEDAAGLCPDEITVILKVNGEKNTVTLKKSEKWTITIKGEFKYTNGKLNEFTVDEVTVPGYSGKVEKKTDDSGNITFTITNTLVTPVTDDPPVLKKLKDTSDTPETDEEFTFVLEGVSKPDGVDEFPMPAEHPDGIVTGKVDEEKEFGTLTFYIAGTYKYKIYEKKDNKEGWTYDETLYEVTYVVTQNGGKMESKRTVTKDGKEVEIAVFVFENEYKAPKLEIKVNKIWKDEQDAEYTRPESITVKLLANGEATDKTLTLNEENKWAGTFTDLLLKKDGKEITYTIEEIEVEYYDSKITGDAKTGFTITNTCNYVPTGDTSNMTPWIVTMLLAMAGMGATVVVRRRRED